VATRWHKREGLTQSFDSDSSSQEPFGGNPPDAPGDDEGDNVTESAIEVNENIDTQQSQQHSHHDTNRTKGQEYKELMTLFQQLAQAAAGSKFGRVVGGIAIQLTKAIMGNADVDVGDGSWASILSVFGGALDTYRSTFSGRRINSAVASLPLQPLSQVGRPQALRLQSNVERGQKRKHLVQTCGFCGALDHQRQTSCPVMLSLGKKITNVPDFLSYLMANAPFSEWSKGPVSVMKSVPNGARHIVIHRKFILTILNVPNHLSCYTPCTKPS
jgi:hypothetical protein